ncbi:MAG: anaerobic ribonucleoside-triphosphate reductase activating protein [Oscillospiraceae bacterium]|nr:anaerobic ribonucleoside-triphosphate reductase activating protein [Oscillospiraceae bacterium]
MKQTIRIHGLQKLSMVDYPGKIAATVFTGGCNLRCPFCHNALLVTSLSGSPQLDTGEVLQFLQKRRGLLDGVVLSGGEPLIQNGVVEFLQAVRDMGFSIKLDTNGCYPDALAGILDRHLADYVAMDIKNTPEKYPQTTGLQNFDMAPIQASLDILKTDSVDCEFRTTVVRELHSVADIVEIGRWLQGAPRYFLQNFEDSGNLIGAGFHGFFSDELDAMAAAAAPYFQSVQVRGF